MRKYIFMVMLLSLVALVGCSKGNDEKTTGDDIIDEEVPVDTEEDDEEVVINPFTGIATDEVTDDRAVAVMVSNVNAARPQTGLTKADMVFELLTEGNITRFMAIFHSEKPEVVGPVRSAREYFFTLADAYDAIYIYSGAATFINNMIKERNIDHIEGGLYDNDGHLIVRENFRKAPHNMYLQFGAVKEVADSNGLETETTYEPLAFLEEGEELPNQSYENGEYVKIDYFGSTPTVEFEYNEEEATYARSNDGRPTVELETEERVEVENVFIVEADHKVIDDELRRAIDIESGGHAMLLRQGKALSLEWENVDGKITPMLDGEVVPFTPGKTWVIFINKSLKEQVQLGK